MVCLRIKQEVILVAQPIDIKEGRVITIEDLKAEMKELYDI